MLGNLGVINVDYIWFCLVFPRIHREDVVEISQAQFRCT